jgi:streptogramin lyase/two-component sensor histidine kinase
MILPSPSPASAIWTDHNTLQAMLGPLHRLAWAFCSLVLSATVCAQVAERARELHLLNITTEDGLPQGMVEDILQDRSGYLWYTTKDGLARSDGYGFTIFKHDASDSTSVAGNHTNLLFEDRKGYLWVAVFGQGLDRYDPAHGRFDHVSIATDLPEESFNEIIAMVEAPDGAIWCLSSYRHLCVVRTDPATGSMSMTAVGTVYPQAQLPVLPSAIAFDEAGLLWVLNDSVLTAGGIGPDGIYQPVQRWSLPAPTRSNVGEVEPHLLKHWAQAQEIILSLPGAFLRISTKDHAVLDSIALDPNVRVQELQLIDDAGRLWYRSDDDAIRRLQLHTGELEHLVLFAGEKNVHDRMETAFFSCQDDRGNFWAGTKGYGILKLSRNGNYFSKRPGEPIIAYFVNTYTIQGHKQFAMTRHRIPQEPSKAPEGLDRYGFATKAFGKVWEGAATDPQGRTWGLLTDGLRSPQQLCYVDKEGRFHRADLLEERDVPNRVFHGAGSDIWVTTSSKDRAWNVREGLLRIDAATLTVRARYEFPVPFLLSKYWPISQWSVAPDGTIWMATIEGLLALDPEANAWQVFKHQPKDPTSLPSDILFSLCPDPEEPEHYLWVGTEGAGMAKFDKRTGTCVRYSELDGLPNDVVYSILSDGYDRLWIGTNTGLCCFDPGRNLFRTYTKADGIAGNEFNRYGSLILPDGSLFFDGMDGGTLFHPDDLEPDTVASRTLLTGVRLAERELAMHQLTNTGTQAAITIPYGAPLIAFRFAVMDHTDPTHNTFRYRMEGYTNGWIDGGTRNEATFTNLDPGTYTFTVQGTNSAGVLDPVGASIALTITPPWWGTWWFRIAVACVFFGGVYGLYRYRLAQEIRVVKLREGIARDLHDEIGSTLSSVSLYGAVARKRIKNLDPVDSEVLESISAGASSAIESMNDIVWAVNSENDALGNVSKRLRAFAGKLCEAQGVALEMNVDVPMAARHFNMAQRKNIYLILKEAVNNALKYSGCTTLLIDHGATEHGSEFKITDNGTGFDMNQRGENGQGGNGLNNMYKRAEAIKAVLHIRSSPRNGTVVTLYVPNRA